MLTDKMLKFADSLDLAAINVGDDDGTLTTDLDLVSANHNIEDGRQWRIYVNVEEAITSGGSATVDFQLEDSADDSSYTDVSGIASGAIAKATLVAGYVALDKPLPDGLARYLRLNIVCAVADLTAGKINAFLYCRD